MTTVMDALTLLEELYLFGVAHAPLRPVVQSYLQQIPIFDGDLGNSSQKKSLQSLSPNQIQDTLLL